jgi:shikimate dehydrogenase
VVNGKEYTATERFSESAPMSENRKVIEAHMIKKKVPTFYFVGVTTSKSSIMKVFPLWVEALGRPEIAIEGIDHELHDDPERYRQTVAEIKYDPLSLGGLVTTHKIDLFEAAREMFDILHPSAQMTGEVSCISKRDNRLIGHAKDILTAGLSLDAVLGENYFARTGGHVLNFGAGGSGKAIALHLIEKENPGDRPERFIMVNRSQPRLDKFRAMVESLETDIAFEFICNEDPKRNDQIIAGLPEGSVVINSTGMGKDRPGSPVTNDGLFPRNGVAWEINYRGELDFWHQAMWQRRSRDVTVEDGWLYFLHGWTQHIAEVLHVDVDEETFDRLAELAAGLRPPLVPKPRPGSQS